MEGLVEKEIVISLIDECAEEKRLHLSELIRDIKGLPPLDVEPVVHARWINFPKYSCIAGYKKAQECSNCHAYYVSDPEIPFSNHKYCAECGAKMDLEPIDWEKYDFWNGCKK